jgi:hypothetical protein
MPDTVNVTYLDFAKREDPDGKISKAIIELLAQTNEILMDMTVIEGNLPVGHRTTVRTGLPAVTWRLLNYGVQPTKSLTATITDSCGMLEAYAQVDKALADLNGNSEAWRLSEEKPIIEAMNQEMARTLFYGDTTLNPERFLGLDKRYFNTDPALAASAVNIIDAGGSTNLTSMWLIIWSQETAHAIFPKGSKAGILFENKGQVTLQDAANGMFEGYRSHYKWDIGFTVRDWRYVVRIANIDTVALATAGDASDTSANLIKFAIRAKNLVPNLRAGRAAWYCNNTVKTYLEVKAMEKSKVISMEDIKNGEGMITRFFGIPVRRVDQIVNAETRITALT